jgi:hypothetical protein
MGFKVQVQTHAIWPVKVNLPKDGGSTDTHSFFVRFKRLSEKDFEKKATEGQSKLIDAVVEAVGESENDLEALTPESKAELLAQTNYRVALYDAYLRMDAGVAAKN